MNDLIYDFETYPNIFSAGFLDFMTGDYWVFEISDRVNQAKDFVNFIYYMRQAKIRGTGYNNEHFDYPIAHFIVMTYEATGTVSAEQIAAKAQAIIDAENQFEHTIWPRDRLFDQVDLMKVNHFDNFARRTSLKKLEINMRSKSVIDLPFPPGTMLDDAQKDILIYYMGHDIRETGKFALHCAEKIKFRDDLKTKYPDLGDVVNFNDTKIGKKFFELELEKAQPGICYERVNGRREKRQTWRSRIALNDVISPYITYKNPEFARVLNLLKATVITETKGALSGISAQIGDIEFIFGTGGIHASLHNTIVDADDEYDIVDVDVASYYPNLAIANRFFPHHLSTTFCDVYENLFNMRQQYPKKSAENAMLKLALNGVYGDSNNIHSPFYDPQYTMSITVNGQLLLCLLVDWLLHPGVEVIQANTDGLTVKIRKDLRQWFMEVCNYWESVTGLKLEYVDYSRMVIRDVNNYLAVKTDGSVKRIGDYTYVTQLEDPYTRERQWHSDQSALVAPKAAEAYFTKSTPVRDFVTAHRDPFDFMLMIRVQKNHRLVFDDGTPVQSTCRYYVSTQGRSLFKEMPPLATKPGVIRRNAVQAGWKIKECNDVDTFDWNDVNWLYYIEEAEKLTKTIRVPATVQ